MLKVVNKSQNEQVNVSNSETVDFTQVPDNVGSPKMDPSLLMDMFKVKALYSERRSAIDSFLNKEYSSTEALRRALLKVFPEMRQLEKMSDEELEMSKDKAYSLVGILETLAGKQL